MKLLELMYLVSAHLLAILRADTDWSCTREKGRNLLLLKAFLSLMLGLVIHQDLGVRKLAREIVLKVVVGRGIYTIRCGYHLLKELIS